MNPLAPEPLAHEVVQSGPSPSRTAFVLHGVLGSGQNFRGLARALSKQRPDFRLVLVDLRGHGDSRGAAPPHTLRACAEDLVRLQQHLHSAEQTPVPVSAIVGHSFGGKVAIAASLLPGFAELSQVFLLDSNPGPVDPGSDHEVLRLLLAVRAIEQPLASRDQLVTLLTGQGFSRGLARWMTTNLRRTDAGYRWRFDLDVIEQLLQDYFRQDFWELLGQPRTRPEYHLVAAEKSDRFDGELRRRAKALPAASRCHFHLIPDAGHWLHVDNPTAVLDLLASTLE